MIGSKDRRNNCCWRCNQLGHVSTDCTYPTGHQAQAQPVVSQVSNQEVPSESVDLTIDSSGSDELIQAVGIKGRSQWSGARPKKQMTNEEYQHRADSKAGIYKGNWRKEFRDLIDSYTTRLANDKNIRMPEDVMKAITDAELELASTGEGWAPLSIYVHWFREK